MKRTIGILGMTLGVLGVVLSVFAALWSVRLFTGAGEFATESVSGVRTALSSAQTALSAASTAPDQAVAAERLATVRAALDHAAAGAESLESNPIVSVLPVDVEGLVIGFGQIAVEDPAVQADALDEAAAGIASAAERLDDFTAGLRRWARLAGVLILLVALWSGWAQYHLAGWGWRAWRTSPPG